MSSTTYNSNAVTVTVRLSSFETHQDLKRKADSKDNLHVIITSLPTQFGRPRWQPLSALEVFGVQWVWSVALYYVEGRWNDDLLDLGRESVTQQLQDQRIRRAALQDQQRALLDQGNKLPALKRKIYYICYEEL